MPCFINMIKISLGLSTLKNFLMYLL